MGPPPCPQSYRWFITAHWARKKMQDSVHKGIQIPMGSVSNWIYSVLFIHLLFYCLVLSLPLSEILFSSPPHSALSQAPNTLKLYVKAWKYFSLSRWAWSIILVIISLLWNAKKTSKKLFMFYWTSFQNVPGVFFSIGLNQSISIVKETLTSIPLTLYKEYFFDRFPRRDE